MEEEEDLLLSGDAMSDSEFFATQNTSSQATQTVPVLVFQEQDIPKIRFNGKLLADCHALSVSAIQYHDLNLGLDEDDHSHGLLNRSAGSMASAKSNKSSKSANHVHVHASKDS